MLPRVNKYKRVYNSWEGVTRHFRQNKDFVQSGLDMWTSGWTCPVVAGHVDLWLDTMSSRGWTSCPVRAGHHVQPGLDIMSSLGWTRVDPGLDIISRAFSMTHAMYKNGKQIMSSQGWTRVDPGLDTRCRASNYMCVISQLTLCFLFEFAFAYEEIKQMIDQIKFLKPHNVR